tara:strand:- start:503 stop:652 length:150 start_codon:yes stop_codon:yes gene_type:complete
MMKRFLMGISLAFAVGTASTADIVDSVKDGKVMVDNATVVQTDIQPTTV